MNKYMSCYAMREDIKGKLICILPYTNISDHVNFWKLQVSKEQKVHAETILKTQDIFLNVDVLKTIDSYFEQVPTGKIFDLSGMGLEIFDYVTYKDIELPGE